MYATDQSERHNATTTTNTAYYNEISTFWRVVIGTVLAFFIVSGCISNGRALLILGARKRHIMRRDTAWILFTLASVNFVSSVITMPLLFTLTVLIPKHYSSLCQLYGLLTDCSIYVNSFCFLLLGINRKDATLTPNKPNRVSVARLKTIIPVLYTSLILLGITYLLRNDQCVIFNPERQFYYSLSRLLGTIAFLVTVIGVSYMGRAYYLIRKQFISIQKNLEQRRDNNVTAQLKTLRINKHVVNSYNKTSVTMEIRLNHTKAINERPNAHDLEILRAIILVVAVFIVTYLPIIVAEVIVRRTGRPRVVLIVLCRIIMLTQNCLNPAALFPNFFKSCKVCEK